MKLDEVLNPNDDLKTRLRKLVNSELDKAEKIWDQASDKMVLKADFAEGLSLNAQMPTNIPGYEKIDPAKPPVDWFVAFVMDMRESSKHLLNAISSDITNVSGLQRIFFETSALLPATAEVVHTYDGKVTEYLGDGVLGLFRATGDKTQQDEACRQAGRAARCVVGDMRDIVNKALDDRYNLPPLNLGVGMAYSQALVTLVGHPVEPTVKAFGPCVYRASKLADLVNEIQVDDQLEQAWPTGKGGFQFALRPHQKHGFKAYILPK